MMRTIITIVLICLIAFALYNYPQEAMVIGKAFISWVIGITKTIYHNVTT